MLKILIVEDEEIIRNGLKHAIDWLAIGCVVVGTAKDAEEGLLFIKERKPDIVIADICMPQVSGLEMIEEGLKCGYFYSIVLTGYSEFKYAKQAIKMGVIDYLLKPVDGEELVQVVNKIKRQITEKKEVFIGREISIDNRFEKIFNMAGKSEDVYVKRTYEIIKERYHEKLSINGVADELNVSPSFLSRRIRLNLNATFVDVLNRYRVNRAISLLNKGTMRIYEIADRVGFNEYKYFCSVFKKYIGVTPSDFLKNGEIIR